MNKQCGKSSDSENNSLIECPICGREFSKESIEDHANKCLFLNVSTDSSNLKRNGSHLQNVSPQEKRQKVEKNIFPSSNKNPEQLPSESSSITNSVKILGINKLQEPLSCVSSTRTSVAGDTRKPLAEHMRPCCLKDLVGQTQSFGPGSMLRSLLEQNKVPNMILWGPPGCGKTSLANVVATICKEQNNLRFVKLSATSAGINDVKEIVKVAKNEAQFKRQTVLFMDEIHRFNKLQQDIFLPHVENGTITLFGATTENPSFSLNNALLSRCKVVVMSKLTVEDIELILERAIAKNKDVDIVDGTGPVKQEDDSLPKCLIQRESLRWLAEVCDGDARVALGALELTIMSRVPGHDLHISGPGVVTLEDVKEGVKRSHMLYDNKGEEHYNTVSAIHKSIRASDDNAALYWTTRAMLGGEDPLFIARRLVRAACEDIGLADSNALVEAVACLQGCQHIGMPECDVLLAQCAVRLARAPKSVEVYHAMKRCQQSLTEAKGPLLPVPLHLRNAPTKLMKQLGYSKGYNTRHKDDSGLSYMPEGLEDVDFFQS